MLTTAGDTEDAEGSREDAERRATMHGDNRGRIAMGSFRKSPPPDADKPIILTPSEGGLHVRPCPSARPSCVVRCALFPLSRTPRQHANSVNVPGNTCLRPTVSLVNTVNLGMLEGREAPLPPAGLQPEDSGRPLILPAAFGQAGEREDAPGDRAAGGGRVEGEHPRAARWSAGLRVDRARRRQALRELARRLAPGCGQEPLLRFRRFFRGT